MLAIGRPLALKFLKIQLLVTLVVAALWAMAGTAHGVSALLGGGISLLGNGFFVWAMFRHSGARKANSIATSMFVGEFGKLLFVVSAFALIFMLTRLPALPLITGFIVTQAVFWFAPLIFRKSAQVKHA